MKSAKDNQSLKHKNRLDESVDKCKLLLMQRVFGLILMIFSVALTDAYAQQPVWTESFETAQKIARETGKPILLDFTADWCPPCRLMEKTFWNRSDVAEFSKQIVFVKLDADKNLELKRKFQVKGLPNVILTDPWGEAIDAQTGFGQNTDRVIIEKLTNLPKDFSALREAGDVLAKDKTNLTALRKFAEFYEQKKLFSYCIPLYRRIIQFETEPVKRENAMLNLANIHLRLGQSTLSLEKFEILLKEFPKSSQTEKFLYGIILAQINKHNLIEAETHFDKLKRDFPQSDLIRQAEIRLADYKSRNKLTSNSKQSN